MNRKTIQKFIDEVNKEPFRKDYVLGMLETLLESMPEENTTVGGSTNRPLASVVRTPEMPKENVTDADIIDKQAEERIKNIKDLAH